MCPTPGSRGNEINLRDAVPPSFTRLPLQARRQALEADGSEVWHQGGGMHRLLFFLLPFLGCGRLCFHLLVFGFGGFHRLASLFGALGAKLGALLTLLVERLLAAEQLDERYITAVAAAKAAADDPQVSAVAVAITRRNRLEELIDGIARHQVSCGLPPRRD